MAEILIGMLAGEMAKRLADVGSKLKKNYRYGRVAVGVFASVLILLGIIIRLQIGSEGDGTPMPTPRVIGTFTLIMVACPTPFHERFREVYDVEG